MADSDDDRSAISMMMLGGAAAAYLVRDTFTDAAATNLTAHTPEVGGTWEVSTGDTFAIASDGTSVSCTANDGETAAVQDTGETDVDIVCTTNPSGTSLSDFGPCWRYASTTAYFFFDFEHAAPKVRIIKFDGGASVPGTNTGGPAVGSNDWTVTLSGNVHTCEITGIANTSIQVTDATHNTNTKHGLRQNPADTGGRFDLLEITAA